VIVRRQREIQVGVEAVSRAIGDRLFKVTVNVHNHTPLTRAEDISREDVLLQSLASTHIIMSAPGGEFVSLLEPPEEYADAAESCKNEGCWPVLVGEAGQRNVLLASPIILYDYPQVAPESAGDFFDGTEMDEMLALRVMTLTDEEKREMRGVDARARHILERTSALPQERLMKLHGKMTPVTVTRPMQARRPSE
jgi:hydrogenase maturation protease